MFLMAHIGLKRTTNFTFLVHTFHILKSPVLCGNKPKKQIWKGVLGWLIWWIWSGYRLDSGVGKNGHGSKLTNCSWKWNRQASDEKATVTRYGIVHGWVGWGCRVVRWWGGGETNQLSLKPPFELIITPPLVHQQLIERNKSKGFKLLIVIKCWYEMNVGVMDRDNWKISTGLWE